MKTFIEYLLAQKEITDTALAEFYDAKIKQASDIDEVLTELLTKCKKQFMRGGKRARPMLVRLAYCLSEPKNKASGNIVLLEENHLCFFFLANNNILI